MHGGKRKHPSGSQILDLGDRYIVGDTYQDKGLQRPTRCELYKLRTCLTSTAASIASCIQPSAHQKLKGIAQTVKKDEETCLGNVESETP